MSFAGLGHRNQCHCSGGVWLTGGPSSARTSSELVVGEGSPLARRLGSEQCASRTERLGVRIQQYLLSGHGRYCHGFDGVEVGPTEGSARFCAVVSKGARVAIKFSMRRWWLGRI